MCSRGKRTESFYESFVRGISDVSVVKQVALSKCKVVLRGLLPLLVSCYCIGIYYSVINPENLNSLVYVAYLSTFANVLVGMVAGENQDNLLDLQILVDYATVLLPLPCICAELWIKNEVSPLVAYLIPVFALIPLIFYILFGYKRQDITDLCILVSTLSMLYYAVWVPQYLAILAVLCYAVIYFKMKRQEECLNEANRKQFNNSMIIFNLLCLLAFEPEDLKLESTLEFLFEEEEDMFEIMEEGFAKMFAEISDGLGRMNAVATKSSSPS